MPYNPQTAYTAPSIFAQSAMAGNQNAMQMGEWLSNFLDRQKQISAAGKSADYFLKANPQAAAEMGIHPDEWNNLGARDKAAAVQGYMQSKAAQGQAAELAARTQWMQEQAVALSQRRGLEEAEAEAWPRLAQALANGGDMSGSPAGPGPAGPGAPPIPGAPDMTGSPMMSAPGALPVDVSAFTAGTGTGPTGPARPMPERMMQALAQMGATNPRLASALARQVLPAMMQNGEGDTMTFAEDPVSGFRFATKGKIVQPSGVNPEKVAGMQMVPQHDEDGNLLGYSQVDARGHAVFHPMKGGAQFKQAVDENGNPIQGFYVDDSGKVHDARGLMQKISGPTGGAPTGANTAKPVALPANRKDWQVGQRYSTNKGELTWNGTKFVQ